MPAFEKDFILRLVKQLAAAIARVLKLKQERRYDEAERQIAEAYRELFGIERRFLPLLRPDALLASLGHPSRVIAFCQLLAQDADLLAARGQAARAADLAKRGLELLAGTPVRDGDLPEREAVLAALRALAPAEAPGTVAAP